MSLCASLWVLVGFYRSLFVHIVSNMFLWVFVGPYASLWVFMGFISPYLQLWNLMGPYGSLCVLISFYRFLCVHRGLNVFL